MIFACSLQFTPSRFYSCDDDDDDYDKLCDQNDLGSTWIPHISDFLTHL